MAQTNFLAIFAPNILAKVKTWLTGKYVEETDTASQNIPAGKWVTWKGQICRTKTAITTGDTLSSTNLDTDEEGSLNNSLVNFDSSYTEIDSYTAANPFVIPQDGYIQVMAYGSAYCSVRIMGPNDTNGITHSFSNNVEYWGCNSIFVKKGMRAYISTKYYTNATARYFKLVI